jgi:hypothetical protein
LERACRGGGGAAVERTKELSVAATLAQASWDTRYRREELAAAMGRDAAAEGKKREWRRGGTDELASMEKTWR